MAKATQELDSPRERLVAMARAYVCGGVNNPALYRLMFGGYLAGQSATSAFVMTSTTLELTAEDAKTSCTRPEPGPIKRK